ncbi:alpha/beta-hydrolase [Myriangium duriaei CBS 260.36]|uniref:Carboxylic ester hydrolase n=1 Tax=Myriangium duriaei CBS 260.36 TaxID=1168546 RepID=A0A9P4IVT0_9PEZI|nr:alpha/beta-hydrolase [Myriangium duriaei CBS 260.36]
MKSAAILSLLGGLGLAAASNCTCPTTGGTSGSGSDSTLLPIVDLGYQVQQASNYNSTGAYYNFSSIRYGAPPVGDLRFAAPQDPADNRTAIQKGQDRRICPQSSPDWESIATQFIPKYLLGQKTFNTSSFTQPNFTVPVADPTENEDCLFLDVFVPEAIWNQRNSGQKFPVLFWIYGGGYVFGSSISSGSPSGLLTRAQNNSQPGVIYVAPNYRLGAFGWLSGPTFQADGGVANLGLYDQRKALQWVQKYIHLFGGDPDRVTVFGESAGGGSVLHQITAYGGLQGPAPFQQAIAQSPGFSVIPSSNEQENTFQAFLAAANVTSLAEARKLPYEQVRLANLITTANATYGQFSYGPVVDGIFTPTIPGQLLARGQFDKNVKVMVGQNKDEGLLFTSPYVSSSNDSALEEILLTNIPTLRGLPDQLNYITNVLYPPVFDGSQAQGYKDQIARSAAITSEFAFICNTFYLDKAYKNNTYSYLFAIPPALHGQDVPYTYYTGIGQTSGSVSAPMVALELQDYITSFAINGEPNEPGVPQFNLYANTSSVQTLEANGTRDTMDPAANKRCDFWQSGIWF